MPRPPPPVARSSSEPPRSKTVELPAHAAEPEPPADRYTLIGELARGGLGRVFSASDDVLGRPVAIKQPLSSSAEAVARFEREAKITARLQHAGVVPVYDFGRAPGGEPFFAMKMVEGRSLHELIRERSALDDRMALLPRVLAVADTVAYAHSQGIIHRDLKPANVIVGQFGETVVIDWGLARFAARTGDASDSDSDDVPDLNEAALSAGAGSSSAWAADVPAGLTRVGRVLGTPQFMAPEQAAGQTLDGRADVYALGAILYNVLAGREPFPGDSQSRAIALARSEAPLSLPQIVPGLPADLVAMVEKAMARQPPDRYPSAGAFAEDLRRFLDGQLVSIHRYSLWTLLRRWLRRHRVAVSLSAALLAALVASAIAGVRGVVAQRNAAVRAQAETAARENVLTLMQAERSLADDPTAAVAWLKRHHPTADKAWVARAAAAEAVALGVARHVFRFALPTSAVAVSPTQPVLAVGRHDGGVTLYDLESGRRSEHPGAGPAVTEIGFAAQGERVAWADAGGGAWLGRLQRRGADWTIARDLLAPSPLVPGRGKDPVWGLGFADDGQRLALVTSGGQVSQLTLGDGARAPVGFALAARPAGLAFCGGALFVADLDGTLQVLPPGATRPRRLGNTGPDPRLHCAGAGRHLISGDLAGVVKLWDVRGGPPRVLGQHDDWISAIASSPDGKVIATGGGDDLVQVLPVAGGPARLLRGHKDTLRGAVFSRDGSVLATASFDSAVRLWDVYTGDLLRELRAPKQNGVTRLTLTADGRQLVASGRSEARVWPFEAIGVRSLRGNTDAISAFGWSGDGRRLASASRDRTVRTWDLQTGARWASAPLESWTMFVRFVEGDKLQVGTRLGRTRRIDPATGQVTEVARYDGYLAELSPDQQRLAYPAGGSTIVQELPTGRTVKLQGGPGEAVDYAFSRDGSRIGVATQPGLLGLWDTASGRPLSRHLLNTAIYALELAADGQWGGFSTGDNRVWLWRLADDRLIEVPSDRQRADSMFFTPDSRTLVYRAWDDTVRLVDVPSRTTHVLRGHRARITRLVRSHNGPPLAASADQNGFIRIWNLGTRKSAVLHSNAGVVENLRFSPDGRYLASSTEEATIRVWDLASIVLTAEPAESETPVWLARRTTAVIDDRTGPQTPP